MGRGSAGLPEWMAAEQKVARLLSKLTREHYLVFNDVEFRYGNIDHLVVRPDGVLFMVETKAHKGNVTTDGKQVLLNAKPFVASPLSQINRSIRWLRNMTEPPFAAHSWIVAVLVFPNARVKVNRSVKRLNVLSADRLIAFIRSYTR